MACIRHLHDSFGIRRIVLTSMDFGDDGKDMILIGSECSADRGQVNAFKISFPKKHTSFTGSGDLFAALIISFLSKDASASLRTVCERALSVMQLVLSRTEKLGRLMYEKEHPESGAKNFENLTFQESRKYLELAIVPSREDIVQGIPNDTFKSISIETQ